ncbi:MAG: type II secretion system F family protein [Candidatus Marsarchaeota archaeon]|nr:type II secretion system F family protein [Candidatus Marsarchaeota archaeon]MCL5094526.1 type II secretion system F family protein [Candidatus Marsarchaeota archaeon]
MFGKDKKRKIIINGQEIELEPKKKGLFKLFNKKPQNIKSHLLHNQLDADVSGSAKLSDVSNEVSNKNINELPPSPDSKSFQNNSILLNQPNQQNQEYNTQTNNQNQNPSQNSSKESIEQFNREIDQKIKNINAKSQNSSKLNPTKFRVYIEGIAKKHKGLEESLVNQGIKSSPYEFMMRIITASLILGILVGSILFFVFRYITTLASSFFVSFLFGFVIFYVLYNTFINFPVHKSNRAAKNVEKNILFAARDILISLRSGMPLFNAISSVSTGYGDTSNEFAKIVEHVELGMSLEQAVDLVVSQSKSRSFKRLMLQASTSIKAGADITTSLQNVIDQLSQERVIELRRYGQRLNALAMFYMLFGVILPSMGIAVMTILTTFISIFTVNITTLELVFVGIVFLQIIFLQLIRQRPVFSM